MAIKAIILDIGGIIIKEEAHIAREILAKKFEFDSMKFKEYAFRRLSESYKGTLHYIDFFREMIKEVGIKATPEEMAKAWIDARTKISKWIEVNKNFLEKLNKKYVTVSLTNSTKLNDSIKIRQDAYKLFKLNVISYEVGARKPEKEIYEALLDKLEQLGIEPNQAVFVDDKEENLVVAKDLGINTLFSKDGEEIESKLEKFGVEV
jgi:putative hydrolase of the HAD superfamily